jgi:hypothetical protein
MNKFIVGAVTTASIAFTSVSANAGVTLVSNLPGNTTGPGSLTLIETFSGGTPDGGTITGALGTAYNISNTSLSNNYLQPAGLTQGTDYFLHIPANNQVALPISIGYALAGGPTQVFGMYVGSPDGLSGRFNSIEFLLGTTSVGTYSFENKPWGTGSNANSTYLTFGGGGNFDNIVFTTSRVAFEMTNFATAVPEPGEWAMMIAGLGVVSLIARRRKQSK